MKQKLLEIIRVIVPNCSNFFFILIKSEKLSNYGPTALILTNFLNDVPKKCMLFGPTISFFQISSK